MGGRRFIGAAIVTQTVTLWFGSLLSDSNAQGTELMVITHACMIGKGRRVNIYIDSRYIFFAIHATGEIWKNWGVLMSAGKEIDYAKIIAELLEEIQLP